MSGPILRRYAAPGAWDDVEVRAYKNGDAAPYRDVTRRVLFEHPELACALRYFEVAPGGHTTLERHRHVHAVVIQRGRGRVLVGSRVEAVAPFDLVEVPSLAWHQFRADADAPLGFLCMVNAQRDRPELPDAATLARLREDPAIAAFIRVDGGAATA